MESALGKAIAARLRDGGDEEAVAFQGRWRSWRWLAEVDALVSRLAGEVPTIGLVARTRPHHLAVLAGSLARHRTTSMIYAAQSAPALAEDIRKLKLPAIVADRQDWSQESLAAARAAGSCAIAIEDAPDAQAAASLLVPGGSEGVRAAPPEIAIELLSSGTTGAPKRIPLAWSTLQSAVDDAAAAYAGSTATHAPQVMSQPLGNISGVSYLAPPLVHGQKIVLLEKFEPRAWAEAVRTFRPVRTAVPPAGVRMILDAGIDPDALSSLAVIGVGGGKVDPETHEQFERIYGIPILHAFGATEFAGVIANWTLETYREWGARKRGSAGRASANVELRILDQETLAPAGAGKIGLLEAKARRIGPDWIRTTDLASIDEDGFLFLHGRADGAINRGGFKIVPDVIAAALKAHPAVADAAAIGIADQRLGEVPVAAVELSPQAQADEAELIAWAKERLLAYQVPVKVRVVPELPRNASLKVSLPDLKALFS